MKNRFLPDGDEPRITWLNNFATKAPAYATKYGLATAELTDLTNGATFFSALINYQNQWQENKTALTAYKNAMRDGVEDGATLTVPALPTATLPTGTSVPAPGIFFRATALAKRIKAHALYVLADGENMGLEGAELAGRGSEVPLLTLSRVAGGQVNVS